MKKRTILGLVCVVVAIVATFVLGPMFTNKTEDTVAVIRLKTDVSRGTQITTDLLEVENVKASTLPSGVLNDVNKIVGKYAASPLYAGDYLTNAKLAGEAISADDAFENLEGKVAVSIGVSSTAAAVSGKLENGDVVRLYIRKSSQEGATTYVPEEMQYLKVVTTTTSSGIDKDKVSENEDGSHDMPATITFLLTDYQAEKFVDYMNGYTMYFGLVYRGDAETANGYIEEQDEILEAIMERLENPDDDIDDDFEW